MLQRFSVPDTRASSRGLRKMIANVIPFVATRGWRVAQGISCSMQKFSRQLPPNKTSLLNRRRLLSLKFGLVVCCERGARSSAVRAADS
jgi:hypothetical protein